MNFKTLLLGTAAALLVAGGASAADLRKAEPVDYVKVCDAFGAGYYYSPGTDTCLKIGGYVRFEVQFDDDNTYGYEDDREWSWRTKIHVDFTAKSMTEMGPLTAFIALEDYEYNDSSYYGHYSGNYGYQASAPYIDEAYLSLGPFLAGYTWSAWAPVPVWAGMIQPFAGWNGWVKTNTIQFNWALNGFGLSLSLDDPDGRGDGYGSIPDIIAVLSAKAGTADLRLGFGYGDRGYDSVWGVTASAVFALDSIAKGDYLKIVANYSDNADDFVSGSFTGITGESYYSIYGQFKHNFSAQWAAIVGAAYRDASYASYNSATRLAFDVIYTPVKNFSITGELVWDDVQNSSTDGLSGTLRIQRAFP